MRESLGKKSCRTKESRKAAYSAGRNTKKFRHRIIMPHMPNNQGIRLSQYRFMKGRSYLINLISYGKATHLTDEGKAVAVVYLDFNKAFDIFSQPFSAHGLDGCTLQWIKKLAG